MTTLTDLLPPATDDAPPDPDAIYSAFAGWATEQGLTLYPHQEEALIEVAMGSNVILSTPTGSGKSLVAAGAHFFALANGQRSYYTAPIKALVSEKFFALIDIFGAANVGMMTGDATVNAKAPIICCTAEILASIALRDGADADVGQVVMDEFHYYSDPDRGWAWQVPLIELPKAQFILMSATLGDVTRFQEDLTKRTGWPTAVVKNAERPVPLVFAFSLQPLHEALDELLTTNQAPAYIVHFTQAAALEQAQALMSTNMCTRQEKDKIAELIGDFRFASGFGKTLSRLVRHGSASTTRACSPSTGGWSSNSPRPACSRSSAAPTPSASASTCRSGRSCSPRCPSTTARRPGCCRSASSIRSRDGRAGPASTPPGRVVVQAPEHVIDNERSFAKALAKTGDDGRGAAAGGRRSRPRGRSPGASPPSIASSTPSRSRSPQASPSPTRWCSTSSTAPATPTRR